MKYLENAEVKNCQPRSLCSTELALKSEDGTKALFKYTKRRRFCTHWHFLKEILKCDLYLEKQWILRIKMACKKKKIEPKNWWLCWLQIYITIDCLKQKFFSKKKCRHRAVSISFHLIPAVWEVSLVLPGHCLSRQDTKPELLCEFSWLLWICNKFRNG